jgi:hypothetical protein
MWYSLISTPITTYTPSRRCNCGGMSTCLILPLTYYSPVSPSVMLTLWLRGHLPERCWTSLILVRPSRRCPPCSHARRRNMTCLTFVRCPAPTHRQAGRADVREMPCSRAHRRNRTRSLIRLARANLFKSFLRAPNDILLEDNTLLRPCGGPATVI